MTPQPPDPPKSDSSSEARRRKAPNKDPFDVPLMAGWFGKSKARSGPDENPKPDEKHEPSVNHESGAGKPFPPRKKATPVSVIIAGILITILTIVVLQIDNWGRDWTNNTAETDPTAADRNLQPIETSLTPTEFADRVEAAMKDVPRWHLENRIESQQDMVRLDFVHSTLIMRFKDDVVVEIVKNPGEGSILYAKSQSRIGKGDLGQNPRNIRELVSTIRKELGEPQED